MATQFRGWWSARQEPNWAELYRAANQNLSTLLDGSQRRQREEAGAQNRAMRAMRAAERESDALDRRTLKGDLKALRAELRGISPELNRLERLYNEGPLGQQDYAAHEELDAMRNTLHEKIGRARDRLAALSDRTARSRW